MPSSESQPQMAEVAASESPHGHPFEGFYDSEKSVERFCPVEPGLDIDGLGTALFEETVDFFLYGFAHAWEAEAPRVVRGVKYHVGLPYASGCFRFSREGPADSG